MQILISLILELTFVNIIVIFLKLVNYRIIFLREDRIGHQAGDFETELNIANKQLKDFKIKTIFVFWEKERNLANKYLRIINFESTKKFGHIPFDMNSHLIFRFFTKLISNGLIKNRKNLYKSSMHREGGTNIPVIRKSIIHKKILEDMGIDPLNYICIYSRDSKYLSERFGEINFNYHSYRNSDIDNLRMLSEYVADNFSQSVIRIGSNVETKLTWASNRGKAKIFDYANSKERTDRNDIELIAGCNLYISNGGGIGAVAYAAKVNVIAINQIPIGLSFANNMIFIPKLLIRKKDSSYLSFKQIIEIDLGLATKTENYSNKGVILKENEEQEILNLYLDYIKFKTNSFNLEEIEIINRYKNLKIKLAKNLNKNIYGDSFVAPSFLFKYKKLLL